MKFIKKIGIVFLSIYCLFFINSIIFASDHIYNVSWYDESRKPEFYGTTEITIDKGMVSSFDIYDSRFRIFAKDFEDGDLTNKIICLKNNVDVSKIGDYNLEYEVTDSHHNIAKITVPVHIVDSGDGVIRIVRTLYSVANLSHLKNVGVSRCDNGDRQSLGIFLPADSAAAIKVIDSDVDMQITYFTNTRAQNSFSTIYHANSEEQVLKNVKNDISYPSVPLITSPRLTTDEYPSKTYKIEVSFKSDVLELNHYHYGDDFEKFKNKWNESNNEFGLIDNETILFVVPFGDIDKINGSFTSVDEMLDYFLQVVNKMDEMIGLSFNPKRKTDQNFRTKYTAVADNGMKGIGAYYEATFIAVCSESASALFQYGWGTLHEIAHGYQGNLGRGNAKGESLYLNETGNNILAHYVQVDKTIYKANHDWMGGSLKQIEEKNNQKRLNGENIFNNQSGTYTNVSEKLYCLVNLFDAFEGSKTYAKLFSYYRDIVSKWGVDKYKIADVYALFFAEEYKANIIPYLNAWTIDVSQMVQRKLYYSNLEIYSITSEVTSDLENFKENNNIDLNYGLVKNSVVNKTNKYGDLVINLEIDNFSLIENKNLGLIVGKFDNEKNRMYCHKINNQTMTIKNILYGTYVLHIPPVIGYDTVIYPVVIKEDQNVINVSYVKHEENSFIQTKLSILGIHNTLGFSLTFDNENKNAYVKLGGADLGNRNTTWAEKPDDVYVSVKIIDNNNNEISSFIVKGNHYFSDLTLDKDNIELEYGYKVVIHSERPDKIIYSYVGSKEVSIDEYKTKLNDTEFLVTKSGLKALYMDVDLDNLLYEYVKNEYTEVINNYQNYLLENSNELNDKGDNLLEKNKVLSMYEKLKIEDQKSFTKLIEKIKKGGSPIIKLKEKQITINQNDETFDIFKNIIITDPEDIYIISDSSSVKFKKGLDISKVGEQLIEFEVIDSDGNISTSSFTVNVIGIKKHTGNLKKHDKIVIASVTVVAVLVFIISSIFKKRKK